MSDLPISIDSLDAVPEESRKFYKQAEDGKFAINPAELLAALNAKDKALNSERKIRTDFETRFNKTAKELESIDREKYTKLMEKEKEWETEKEQRERETLEAKGKYEEALERAKANFTKELSDLKTDYEKKLKKSQETIERVEGDKKNYILNDTVRRAITKSGVFADDVEDVLTLIPEPVTPAPAIESTAAPESQAETAPAANQDEPELFSAPEPVLSPESAPAPEEQAPVSEPVVDPAPQAEPEKEPATDAPEQAAQPKPQGNKRQQKQS